MWSGSVGVQGCVDSSRGVCESSNDDDDSEENALVVAVGFGRGIGSRRECEWDFECLAEDDDDNDVAAFIGESGSLVVYRLLSGGGWGIALLF